MFFILMAIAFFIQLDITAADCMGCCKRTKLDEHYRDQFEKRINASSLITTKNGTEFHHPLLYDARMDELFNLAINTKKFIKTKWPKDKIRLFSLGQSPAWLIAMMQEIDRRKKITDTEYKYLAFSGHFYDLKDGKLIKSKNCPSKDQCFAYRKYLKECGLSNHPEGTRACIVEFPNFSKGIRSFYDVAQPALPPKEHFNFLVTPPNVNDLPPHCEKLDFVSTETVKGLIYELARTDKFDDRLVLNFQYPDWQTKNPDDFKRSASAQLMHEIMCASLDTKFKK